MDATGDFRDRASTRTQKFHETLQIYRDGKCSEATIKDEIKAFDMRCQERFVDKVNAATTGAQVLHAITERRQPAGSIEQARDRAAVTMADLAEAKIAITDDFSKLRQDYNLAMYAIEQGKTPDLLHESRKMEAQQRGPRVSPEAKAELRANLKALTLKDKLNKKDRDPEI